MRAPNAQKKNQCKGHNTGIELAPVCERGTRFTTAPIADCNGRIYAASHNYKGVMYMILSKSFRAQKRIARLQSGCPATARAEFVQNTSKINQKSPFLLWLCQET